MSRGKLNLKYICSLVKGLMHSHVLIYGFTSFLFLWWAISKSHNIHQVFARRKSTARFCSRCGSFTFEAPFKNLLDDIQNLQLTS